MTRHPLGHAGERNPGDFPGEGHGPFAELGEQRPGDSGVVFGRPPQLFGTERKEFGLGDRLDRGRNGKEGWKSEATPIGAPVLQ